MAVTDIPRLDPKVALSVAVALFEGAGINVVAHAGVVLLYDKKVRVEDLLEAIKCLEEKVKIKSKVT